MNLIKILKNFFFLIIFNSNKILFIFFFFINRKKILNNKILIIQHEGGYGHTIHDAIFFKMYYSPETISYILFYDRKRHNKYVKNFLKGINYFNFHIFLLSYNQKVKLMNYVESFIKRNTNIKIINNYHDAMLQIINDRENDYLPNVPRNNHHHWTKFFFKLLDGYDKYENLSINHRDFRDVEKKIAGYFKIKEIETKKIITVYLKQKIVINGIFSGLPLEDWIKILNKLSKEYNIYLFGDYSSIDKYNLNKNIIYSEILKIDKQIWSLYAPMKNDFFIGENGAPLYIPAIIKKKMLVLNSYPWTYAQPNSIFAPKLINLEKSEHNNISEIFEKYSFWPSSKTKPLKEIYDGTFAKDLETGTYPEVLSIEITERIIQRYLKGDYDDKNNAINPKDKFNLNRFSLFNLVDCRIPIDWYNIYNS